MTKCFHPIYFTWAGFLIFLTIDFFFEPFLNDKFSLKELCFPFNPSLLVSAGIIRVISEWSISVLCQRHFSLNIF